MNGYSQQVAGWSNERLLREYAVAADKHKFSGPSEDGHWIYRAILEELKRRDIDPRQTIRTPYGIVIPCNSAGRPLRDEPRKFIR